MIKINKVKSLKKEEGTVRYGKRYKDLKPGTPFLFADTLNFKIKTPSGHTDPKDGATGRETVFQNDLVIPVDAEINWAYKDGE